MCSQSDTDHRTACDGFTAWVRRAQCTNLPHGLGLLLLLPLPLPLLFLCVLLLMLLIRHGD